METLTNLVGIGGVASMMIAYFLLQQEKLTPHHPTYLWMNLLGGLAVIFSLFYEWNLSAFIMEALWVLVSAHSLIRYRKKQ